VAVVVLREGALTIALLPPTTTSTNTTALTVCAALYPSGGNKERYDEEFKPINP